MQLTVIHVKKNICVNYLRLPHFDIRLGLAWPQIPARDMDRYGRGLSSTLDHGGSVCRMVGNDGSDGRHWPEKIVPVRPRRKCFAVG